jgi:TrmH family RNA methyltransferase
MPERISSLQNPRVKLALRLRHSSDRRETGLTRIDGQRELEMAMRAGVKLHTVFATEADLANAADDLLLAIPDHEKIAFVPPNLMDKLQYGERTTDLLAIAEMPPMDLDRLAPQVQSLVVVLDQAEKPGNIGAVLRTADAVGATAVVLADPVCDPFNPNAIRASQGTIFTVPIATATSEQTIAWLRQAKLQMLATRVDATRSLYDHRLTQPTAFIFGSESRGLGENWNQPDVHAVSLPMLGQADSLNLSTTAAICLYESLRQRQVDKS